MSGNPGQLRVEAAVGPASDSAAAAAAPAVELTDVAARLGGRSGLLPRDADGAAG